MCEERGRKRDVRREGGREMCMERGTKEGNEGKRSGVRNRS